MVCAAWCMANAIPMGFVAAESKAKLGEKLVVQIKSKHDRYVLAEVAMVL